MVRPLTVTVPVPGLRKTRAVAHLRLPVPYCLPWIVAWGIVVLPASLSEAERFGLLRRMRVRRPRVDLELVVHRATERRVREHALDGLFDRERRLALHQLPVRLGAEATRITGVLVVVLLL